MMCGHTGCPHRVTQAMGYWYHIDTHGVTVDHDAVDPTEAESETLTCWVCEARPAMYVTSTGRIVCGPCLQPGYLPRA